MTGRAPLPRSGRLLAGANSLELLWATLACLIVLLTGLVSTIGWVALWVEGQLTGFGWPHRLADMPALLLAAATGDTTALHPALERPLRPVAVAAALTLLAGAAASVGLRRWVDWQAGWRHRQRTRQRLHSPTWARRRDLAGLLTPPPRTPDHEPPAHGRLFVGTLDGRDVLAPTRTSVMVVAPTRTGKSTRLVVPNLLRWDGPAVVTSVKPDVLDLTASRRATHGPVALFDPTGATGRPSVRWSPLLTSTTFPDATRTAGWLAEAAAVEERQDAAKFWQTLATKLLAPLLFAAANTGRTMREVSHWVDRADFDQVATELDRLADADAIAAWKAVVGLPAETRGSVLGTAMAIFRAFGSPRVQQATSCTPGDTTDTLNVPRLLRTNGTLYLVSPEYEQAELRPVFVALVQAVYRAAVDISANQLGGAPLSPPLLLMLDEAGNIAPLHSLPRIASTGAGQGITLMTIWQDRAQIRELFDDAERTVISNHTTSVWLPGSQDLDTLRLLCDLVGDQWVASTTISAAPDGGVSVSEGSERIDVAPPAFLRTLDASTAVMLSGNLPPALIRTHPYYNQPRWRRHIPDDILARHAAMHDGTGPTTQQAWHTHRWHDDLPTVAPTAASSDTPDKREQTSPGPGPRGSLGTALTASYPPIRCNEIARRRLGPAGEAIPARLSGAPRRWHTVDVPTPLAAELAGATRIDLTDPAIRQWALPVWMEAGPAEAFAQAISLPLLRSIWDQLDLTPVLRHTWEACFPALTHAADPAPTPTHAGAGA